MIWLYLCQYLCVCVCVCVCLCECEILVPSPGIEPQVHSSESDES